MHVDDVGLGVEMVVPHILEQHGAGDDLPRVFHQIFEQPYIRAAGIRFPPRRRASRGATSGRASSRRPGSRLLAPAAAAARQHLDARQQLGKRIGLWQIVVAAGAQALDASSTRGRAPKGSVPGFRRPWRAASRSTRARRAWAACGRRSARRTAPSVAMARPSSPSVGGIGDMADLAERLHQIVRGVAIVLDNEKAHGDPVRLRIGPAAERTLPLNIRRWGHRSHQFSVHSMAVRTRPAPPRSLTPAGTSPARPAPKHTRGGGGMAATPSTTPPQRGRRMPGLEFGPGGREPMLPLPPD